MYCLAFLGSFGVPPRKLALLLSILPLAMVVVLLSASPGGVLAEQPEIKIDVIPASVNLPPQGTIEVQVAVTNLSSNILEDIRLSSFSDADIEVANVLPGVSTLLPGDQYVWPLYLSHSGTGPLSGTLQLRVDYKVRVAGKTEIMQRVTFNSITVNSLKPEADVQVETPISALNQQQPGTIYLIVTNKSDFTLVVKDVTWEKPDFINLAIDNFKGDLALPSHQTRTIAINASISGAAQPGKQVIVFKISYEWSDAKQKQQGTLIATQEINTNIFGESQILSLLGIPTLLVLPGFLALITIRLMGSLMKDRTRDDTAVSPLLDHTKPEFWLIAIMLSVAAAFIYPYATQAITGVSRNYLVQYELTDVVTIWLASVGLAVIIYLLYRIYVQRKLEKIRELTPEQHDTPLHILRKLIRQKRSFMSKYITVNSAGNEKRFYLLESDQSNKEELWVSPTIIVEVLENIDESLQARLEKYLTYIENIAINDPYETLLKPDSSIEPLTDRPIILFCGSVRRLVILLERFKNISAIHSLAQSLAVYAVQRLSVNLGKHLVDVLNKEDKAAWNIRWGGDNVDGPVQVQRKDIVKIPEKPQFMIELV